MALTTLDQVEQFRGKVIDHERDELTDLIDKVSSAMVNYMQTPIEQTTVVAEKHDGSGTDCITVKIAPILSISEVRVDDVALDADDYVFDDACIFLTSGTFNAGRRNVEVDYTGGYADVPADLSYACTLQVAYQHTISGKAGRLGEKSTALQDGGTHQYVVAAWYPSVREIMDHYRRPKIV